MYRHLNSRALRDILVGMLRYSNNFTANQLFLTLGAQASGYPATTETSQEALQHSLLRFMAPRRQSGPPAYDRRLRCLGRHQRTTASGFMRVLEKFLPYADLLPVSGSALRKSGTLTGVYNYAGYLNAADGLYPFVILTNQPENRVMRC